MWESAGGLLTVGGPSGEFFSLCGMLISSCEIVVETGRRFGILPAADAGGVSGTKHFENTFKPVMKNAKHICRFNFGIPIRSPGVH